MGLSESEQRTLLKLARDALAHHLGLLSEPPTPELTPTLKSPRGAFVTLYHNGKLRGCIGAMVTADPLWKTISRMAIQSATNDPRFDKLRPEELDQTAFEISVLSPLTRGRPEDVEVGVHGILISQGFRRGVLLPQVATKYRWDQRSFLEQTCHKAGLPADAWKDPETVIELFSADVFAETERH